MARASALIGALTVALIGAASVARAQPLRPAGGVTAVFGAHPIGLAQAGLEGDAGFYARFGLVAGLGATVARDAHAVGEVAAVGRFLLDPFRRSARGVYATGGLAARLERPSRPRWLILAGVGVEGRPLGPVMPAVEAGIGGGARIGVVLRPVRRGRR